MSSFYNIQGDAIGDLDKWSWLFRRKGFVFVSGQVFLLDLVAELALDFEVLLVSGQRVAIFREIPSPLVLLLLLNEDRATSEMGSRYFCISLYSLNLTILSMLSNTSLFVFFLDDT